MKKTKRGPLMKHRVYVFCCEIQSLIFFLLMAVMNPYLTQCVIGPHKYTRQIKMASPLMQDARMG